MEKSYLPIGSVVLLKNATKKIMITGFYIESDNKIYDYVGCLYPEGVVSSTKNLVFNEDQIDKIFFIGFNDIEGQAFKNKLNDLIKQQNNKSKENKKDDIK